MAASTVHAGLLARVAPQIERFINRNILGIEPDPDHWPAPSDCGSLLVPGGIITSDDTGETLILGREFTNGWPRRRTVIGAHAYRFEDNGEYDCGWRLADVAARLIRAHAASGFDLVSIVPPADTYGHVRVLPWIGERLAKILDAEYLPRLFETATPVAVHPDLAGRTTLPLTEMFRIGSSNVARLGGARVLLLDWRRHSGRALLTLARMLRKKDAQVTRFVWLG